ncbi:hypothetical protein ACFVWP_46995 [Streptomyces sp. NPDC058175]|uniref:hypothetical protein n=1 Tax=Streptomyces sp. NPDC058175 TaxID=3346367 RepID=UPI0036EE8FE6
MTDTPMHRINGWLEAASSTVLSELDAIKDPLERQGAARDVLENLLPAIAREVKANRGRAVAELREGRTLAQVGELLGMSTARVDQILKGK